MVTGCQGATVHFTCLSESSVSVQNKDVVNLIVHRNTWAVGWGMFWVCRYLPMLFNVWVVTGSKY